MTLNVKNDSRKRIVIIGAGFAGIELAKKLRNKPFQVIILDKNNYHTFQPLLYQVATGGLEPNSIAYPVRNIFKKAKNIHFRMAEVRTIYPELNYVSTNKGNLEYDYLVMATGTTNNFFNLESKKDQLLPLKTVNDALYMRNFILRNFEEAVFQKDENDQNEFINIAIVGGGPTGIELAGALAELKRYVLPADYPEINFERMKIQLYEAGPKLLGSMSDEASNKTLKFLEKMGIKVFLNSRVESYEDQTVKLADGTALETNTVIWSAGVKGVVIEGLKNAEISVTKRYKVNEFHQMEGYDNVFAIGDISQIITEKLPKGHPMMAPVAIQQGRNLAANFIRKLKRKELKPFVYVDKGSMATIGRNRAVVDMKNVKFQGFFAWLTWLFVHMMYLVGFRNKIVVLLNWMYNYFTYDRAIRLIINPVRKLSEKQFRN